MYKNKKILQNFALKSFSACIYFLIILYSVEATCHESGPVNIVKQMQTEHKQLLCMVNQCLSLFQYTKRWMNSHLVYISKHFNTQIKFPFVLL